MFKIIDLDLEKEKQDDSIYPCFTMTNQDDYSDPETVESVINAVSTLLSTKEVSIAAQCQCGHLLGNYLINKTCMECDTKCLLPDPEYKPTVWYSISKDVDHTFMHPWFLIEVNNYFKSSFKMEFIRFLNAKSQANAKHSKYIPFVDIFRKYANDPKETRLNIFKKHWVDILRDITEVDDKYHLLHNLINYYIPYTNLLSPKSLPILSKRIMVIEKSKAKKQTLALTKRILKFVDITTKGFKTNHDQYDELDYINLELALLFDKVAKNKEGYLSSKPGLIRRHIGGSPTIYSLRNVITLLNKGDSHKTDEIHIPYSTAVSIFRYHVMNRLYKKYDRQIPLYQFRAKINKGERNFDIDLYEIIEQMLVENNGVRTTLLRNPIQSSYGLVSARFTHVKKDLHDLSFGLSPVALEPSNADIDGDELHAMMNLFKGTKLTSLEHGTIPTSVRNTAMTHSKVFVDPTHAASVSTKILKEEIEEGVIPRQMDMFA